MCSFTISLKEATYPNIGHQSYVKKYNSTLLALKGRHILSLFICRPFRARIPKSSVRPYDAVIGYNMSPCKGYEVKPKYPLPPLHAHPSSENVDPDIYKSVSHVQYLASAGQLLGNHVREQDFKRISYSDSRTIISIAPCYPIAIFYKDDSWIVFIIGVE